jgi:hypothetical protein
MKTFFRLAAVILLTPLPFSGCGEKPADSSASTNNTSSSSPLTAPVDYLGAVGKAQQTAVKTVDTVSIKQAVQMFQVEQGRLPKDLNELVEEKYLPRIPDPPRGMKYVYDPNNGSIRAINRE